MSDREVDPHKFYPIPGWECYAISKDAQIVRVKKNKGAVCGLVLSQYLHKTRGYLTVRLFDGDRKKTFDVHKLMAMTFFKDVPDGYHVCHNDGIKTNCKLENLRIDTKSSNEMDKIKHGTSNRGERNGNSKHTEDLIRKIKHEIKNGINSSQLAKMFGMTPTYIRSIKNGYKWSWVEV